MEDALKFFNLSLWKFQCGWISKIFCYM